MERSEPAIVFCREGIERSSAAVAWFLFRRRGMTIPDAFSMVKAERPFVQERLEWLHGEGFLVWW
jgi:hypothetical protein